MKTTKNREEVLANALEELHQQNDTLKEEITKLTEEISQLKSENDALSINVATASKSMVSWEDHQNDLNLLKKELNEYAKALITIKAKYDKLVEERRYWATQQWAKHFFRWIFHKRHLGIWVIFLLFSAAEGICFFTIAKLRNEITMLHSNDLKYRFIKAWGQMPQTVQFLEDAFDEKDAENLRYIYQTVKDYEHALLLKSDSIVKAERKKMKDLR